MTKLDQAQVDVHLWGRQVGTVTWDEVQQIGRFRYCREFLDSGLQPAPVTMPLDAGHYTFPDLNSDVFKGLPGFIADSLPDKFGDRVVATWLRHQGQDYQRPDGAPPNPVMRLCLLGSKGMGALEYRPDVLPAPARPEPLDLPALVALINRILANETAEPLTAAEAHSLEVLAQIGTSADGSRAKAVVACAPDSDDLLTGQTSSAGDNSYWLLKFDGITGNRDREAADPQGWGLVEYAYYLMAREAGIEMAQSRLLQENGRSHFLTSRFDRTADGSRLHRQSLCAIGHMDFDALGAYSYEQVVDIIRQLELPQASVEEHFRRAVFNVLARNHDDHAKNISFLMDQQGRWSLAPAYDLTFAYNPEGHWTNRHQMTFNGKRDGFESTDFLHAARRFDISPGRAQDIVQQVAQAVRQWPAFAEQAGVDPQRAAAIYDDLRLHVV